MTFQFVENSEIDGSTRKVIRSHVMKGKNVGKKRRQSTRKEKQPLCFNPRIAPKLALQALPRQSAKCDETIIFSVPRTQGSTFSSLSFPSEMQAYGFMEKLIYQFMVVAAASVYPTDFCLPIDSQKHLLFQYLLSDEAFFYSALAMSEVSMDSLLGKQETSLQTLQHLSNTYRCIRQNIQKNGTPTDPTIAAVMSMAIHENLRGHPERAKIHVDALCCLVELRGGLDKFESSQVLLQKMCRADLEYALHAGSRPRFNRDKFPHEFVYQSMLSQCISQRGILNIADDTHFHDPILRSVFVDLMKVTCLLNRGRICFRMNPYAYQEVLISVLYRLLHYRSLDNENPLCFGLLAMITTLFFQYARSERLSYNLLAKNFRTVIERRSSNGLNQDSFLLWLLFIGGISVLHATDEKWLHTKIRTCLATLRINSWPQAREKIKKFPWIDAAHDILGQKLWEATFKK